MSGAAREMTLADFLLARVAEDEAAAREAGVLGMTGERWKQYPAEAYREIQAATLAHARRVLTECKVRRSIMDVPVSLEGRARWHWERTLQLLTLPYQDHPDWREEWR